VVGSEADAVKWHGLHDEQAEGKPAAEATDIAARTAVATIDRPGGFYPYATQVLDRPHHPLAKPVRRLFLLGLVVFLVVAGVSVLNALTAPGTDSTSARLAEWARDHNMGDLVVWLEQQQYQHNVPKVGGAPAGGIAVPGGVPRAPSTSPTTPKSSGRTGGSGAVPGGTPVPAPLTPLALGSALPGEGQWQTVVANANGQAAVRVAQIRPDDQHTSYLAGVLWIDPTMVRGQLRPGTMDPGGSWQASSALTKPEYANVAAAFNAGFRLSKDGSHGGYFSEGHSAYPLQDNAASLVLRTDGTATVGSWNNEVRMDPTVVSVRQNLTMLVDNGKVNPTCLSGGNAQWGSTIGNRAFVDRSAFGVTADGAEVYVGGPALSVCTLGRILQDAGVVRGMELDINPAWITGVYYHTRPGGQEPLGYHLYPTQGPSTAHYISPSSRDWYAWFLRD
jgi:hypothetical protein